MQNKRRLQKHLLVIYIIYFAALAVGFVASIAPDFSRGQHHALRTLEESDGQRFYMVTAHVRATGDAIRIKGLPPEITPQTGDLTLRVACDEPMTVAGALHIVADSPLAYAAAMLPAIAYLVTFVLIALIINSLRKSIRLEQPLRHSNILRTRAIGILLLAAALCETLFRYLNMREAARLLAGTPLEVAGGFPLNYWDLIVGILFLFMAEVLSLGTQLSEEQKLTI